MKKLIITTTIGLITGYMSFGQQEAMFTHYMYNNLAVNPAYAGSHDAVSVTAIHRSQWVGFNGAPVSQTLTMHTPLEREELGVGISLLNDKIGPASSTSLFGDFSYTMEMSQEHKLSFGLKTGLNIFRANLNEVELNEQNDGTFEANIQNKLLPNVGCGFYYRAPEWYVGLSTPKIIQNNYLANLVSDNNTEGREKRHYYLIAGTVLDINENVKFKPTTYIKATAGAPVEADLTSVFIFNEKFLGGLMLRTGDAMGALVGVYLDPQIELGYSFDWSYGLSTGRSNGGSHEIVLRYDFSLRNQSKIKCPVYF